jgi:hypothetical protein
MRFPSNIEFMVSSKNNPTNTAGIIEIIIEIEKLCDTLCFFSNNPLNISQRSFLKKKIVLNAVAVCKTIVNSKLSLFDRSFPKITLEISKCPLEDIGKNSVRP